MKRIGFACTVVTFLVIGYSSAQPKQTSPPPDVKMNQFVVALIKRMTLDEKIGQLTLFTSDIIGGKCGNIFNAYTPAYVRKLQDLAMQKEATFTLSK